jgi:hypothetical protein
MEKEFRFFVVTVIDAEPPGSSLLSTVAVTVSPADAAPTRAV